MDTTIARDLARRLHLGRAALMLYHRPVGLVLQSIAEGGPWEQRRTELGRQAMIAAASGLRPLAMPTTDSNHEVHFLTGKNYWYQTLFCFCSLQMHVPVRINPVIHDDGSLTPSHCEAIERVIPWVRFEMSESIEARLDVHLPASRFPTLRRQRLQFSLLKKIVDIHCGREGWRLFLDSDMLFFRFPRMLLDWLDAPSCCLHLIDADYAYGYSDALMDRLAGAPVPPLVNSGIVGLRSETMDWDLLEAWWRTMLETEGPHYLQEQSVFAMIVASRSRLALPPADYIVLPSLAEGRAPRAVLHHYVAHSKRAYFQHGWRRVAARLEQRA